MEVPMKTETAVLYYHRVYEKQCDINLLCVAPKKFEQQMKYLKKISIFFVLRRIGLKVTVTVL